MKVVDWVENLKKSMYLLFESDFEEFFLIFVHCVLARYVPVS